MKAIIASLLCAISFSTYTQAIPLDFDPTTVPTLSQTNLTGTDGGGCAPPSEYYHWVKSGWLREDCYAAFNMMRSSVLTVKDVRHTFVDIRSKSSPPKTNEVMTPKKYTASTCTMALVLISTFERREGSPYLPGAKGYPFVAKDSSTYADIIQGVVKLEDLCLARQSKPGWIQLGTNHGLGAFFWATGSPLDEDFPGWTSSIGDTNPLNETDAGPIFESKPQLTS